MPQPLNATAAEELASDAGAKPAGWKLIEDAPTPDVPLSRDRAGAQRGLMLILLGGGLFWGAVAAALWFAVR